MHEVKAKGIFLLFIKYTLGEIWYYDRFHMLDLVVDCFILKMWHTGSIDFLSHPYIFSQNLEALQDIIINCV